MVQTVTRSPILILGNQQAIETQIAMGYPQLYLTGGKTEFLRVEKFQGLQDLVEDLAYSDRTHCTMQRKVFT
ncbi:MAG TPA: hypothetical protein V6D07_05335 [Trichocoleus sp.]